MTAATRNNLSTRLDRLDIQVASWMAKHGVRYLRASLGVVFLWFGALKLIPGLSPAEGLAGQTILAITFGLVPPDVSVPLLGIFESLLGVALLTGWAMRLSLVVLVFHMCGTATPLLLFPAQVFASGPLVLTMEGQYIIKNIVFVSAAFVVAATVRGGKLRMESTGELSRRAVEIALLRVQLLAKSKDTSDSGGSRMRTGVSTCPGFGPRRSL